MDHWYFAYGSNMSRTQMAGRTGPIRDANEAPRVALLRGYRFAFTVRSTDGRIYANVMASPDDVVHGVLYRCGEAGMQVLDRYEAGYERRQVTVTDQTGREYEATVYVGLARCTVEPGQPTARYREIVLQGAREFGLPEEYVAEIERLANAGGSASG
jgi:cation transport regulator ChaC